MAEAPKDSFNEPFLQVVNRRLQLPNLDRQSVARRYRRAQLLFQTLQTTPRFEENWGEGHIGTTQLDADLVEHAGRIVGAESGIDLLHPTHDVGLAFQHLQSAMMTVLRKELLDLTYGFIRKGIDHSSPRSSPTRDSTPRQSRRSSSYMTIERARPRESRSDSSVCRNQISRDWRC